MSEKTQRKVMIVTYVAWRIITTALKWVLCITAALLLAWFLFSVSEVWAHNFDLFKDTNPTPYSDINIFVWLANL